MKEGLDPCNFFLCEIDADGDSVIVVPYFLQEEAVKVCSVGSW